MQFVTQAGGRDGVNSGEGDAPPSNRIEGRATSLVLAVAFLTGIGLIAIYAASSMKGYQQFGDSFLFFRKQAFGAFVGFAAIAFVALIPFKWIERATVPILLAALVALALIFVPGMYTKAGGATRWLALGGLSFQPAELAKIALVMFLAKNLARPATNLERLWSGLLPNVLVFGLLGALLMVQPDFGSTVLLGMVTLVMLFSARLPFRFLAATGGLAIGGFVLAVLAEPYRMARLFSFLDPWSQMRGGGFQIIQSYLAFQNGGLLGVGLGESKQKLFFLPEAHTDFILSVIGEELGLLGVLLICSLFAFVAWSGFSIAQAQKENYRKFLAFGLTSLIAFQAMINMGVTMGMLPTKGIPLPFISSGTTSLMAFLLVTALLARLGWDAEKNESHSARLGEQ